MTESRLEKITGCIMTGAVMTLGYAIGAYQFAKDNLTRENSEYDSQKKDNNYRGN